MSSCRATSFYVAPGRQRYFSDATLATYFEGTWHEFSHRRDLERFADEHRDWDQVCYVGAGGGIEALRAAIVTAPESVDLWKISPRVVNGRAPEGPAHTLYTLASRGVKYAGGVAQARARLFPGANKSLAAAAARALSQPGGHLALSIGVALRPHLGDDAVASMLETSHTAGEVLAYRPVDPGFIEHAYRVLSERYSVSRALSLISQAVEVRGLDDFARMTIAKHPSAIDSLEALARDPWARVRVTLVEYAEINGLGDVPHLLRLLAGDADQEVSHAVAVRPETPLDVLERLAKSPDIYIRTGVAMNPGLPTDLFTEFLKRENADLHSSLARNRGLPPWAVTELLGDPDWAVPALLVQNPACPPEVLARLATEGTISQRGSVARNAATPPEVLHTLSHNNDPDVRELVGLNPSCPPEILSRLYEDPVYAVVESVLFNPSCPPEILSANELSGEINYRGGVASNPSTPPEVLARLYRDGEAYVSGCAGRNPSAPTEVRMEYFTKSRDPDEHTMAAVLAAEFGLTPTTVHPGVARLLEMVVVSQRALDTDDVIWPERPKSIFELPGRDALPWDTNHATDYLVGKSVLDQDRELSVRRLDSPHAVEVNANYMGNCTAGYAYDIATGGAVILALDDASGKTLYNVEVRKAETGPYWQLGQVNSRFNTSEVPETIRQQLAELVDELRSPALA
jgi:hypothetical protein